MAGLQVALVTGGGSGIGRAVARGLAQDGFCVALLGRRASVLEALAAELPDGRVLVLPADVSLAAEVEAAFSRLRDRFGRLDLLFNNAGAAVEGAADELSPEAWEEVVRTNLTGAFHCASAAFRLMKAQTPSGGRIINNGSVSAQSPRPRSAAYTAAKHGLLGLTRSLALDGRDFGVACGQIDIGNVRTELSRSVICADPSLAVDHVVSAVRFMAALPPDVNVHQLTITPTRMPFIGRG